MAVLMYSLALTNQLESLLAFLHSELKGPTLDILLTTVVSLPVRTELSALAGYLPAITSNFADHKSTLLQWYIKLILETATPLDPEVIRCWDRFTQHLNTKDIESLFPAIDRALKRSPESAMISLHSLFRAHPITKDAPELVKVVQSVSEQVLNNTAAGIRSGNESQRLNSLKLLSSLAENALLAANPAIIEHQINTLGAALKAKVPNANDRINIFKAYATLSRYVPSSSQVALATTVVDGLTTLVETEANEAAKAAGLEAVGQWLPFITSAKGNSLGIDNPTNAKIRKVLTTILASDKVALRKSALICIDASFPVAADHKNTWGDASAAMKELSASVIKVAKNAKIGFDGFLALKVLMKMCLVDKTIDAQINKDKVWASVLKLVCKPAVVTKLTEEELLLVIDSVAYLLQHSNVLQLSSLPADTVQPLFGVVQFLNANSNRNVRLAANAAFNATLQANPKNSELFVQSIEQALQAKDQPNAVTFHSEAPTSVALRSALLSSVAPSITPATLSNVLILASSPAFGTKNDSIKFWKVISRKIKSDVDPVINGAPALVDTVISQLENSEISEPSLQAISTLSKAHPNVFVPLFSQKLRTVLREQKNRVGTLTETELAIYETPEGELYNKEVENQKQQGGKGAPAQDSREKKRRGEHGLYTEADKKWEENFRKEQEAKKKAQGNAPVSKEVQKELEKESQIRKEVGQVFRSLDRALEGVRALLIAKASLREQIPYLIEPVMEVLSVPEVCAKARQLLIALGSALDLRLSVHAPTLGHLLATVQGYTEISSDPSSASQITEALLSKIEKMATQGKHFSSANLYYILPIIGAALLKGYSFGAQESAFNIMELHSKATVPVHPRAAMISICRYLIANGNINYQNKAKTILIDLASQSQLTVPEFPIKDHPVGLVSVDQTPVDSLLSGLMSPSPAVRNAVLQGLEAVPGIAQGEIEESKAFSAYLWLSRHDTDADNAVLGDKLWKLYRHELPEDYVPLLQHFIFNKELVVQGLGGRAIAGAVKRYPDTLPATVAFLLKQYRDNSDKSDASQELRYAPNVAAMETRKIDPNIRAGVTIALGSLASVYTLGQLSVVVKFMLGEGLFDQDKRVFDHMIQTGVEIVTEQGPANSSALLKLFEDFLAKPSENAAQDRVRESVVIFLGHLAKHLDPTSNSLPSILQRVLDALKTPSESVQRASSKCLIGLMPVLKDTPQAEKTITYLLNELLNAPDYAERRGAAFGIAGTVKGLGIPSLKKYNIMQSLQDAVEDKRHANGRQGALFAIECLSTTLERLFEPFVIGILPKLLKAFGDGVADVRTATTDASKAIMSQLSAHGVKIVLPALLKALDDRNWRTKTGSIELLGSMAFCAPKQLSACLPSIVPRLSEVLNDTHMQVQESAREALGHIGSVIRNQEIQQHVPVLLKALDDPDLWGKEALEALIHTNFVHTIDPPSLSLIVPLLHRGLKDRSSDTKKKAAQIIGNMCSLVEHKDLEPYLPDIFADMKVVIVDPIPEVRATASKALGSLVKGLGEEQFAGVIPWFLENMKSSAGNVERSGSAQGLSEVLAGLDPARFENLLPDILSHCNHAKAHVREGYLGLFIFLPSTVPAQLQSQLAKVLPSILQGLSDETESVRDISLRAGQAIVNQYARTSLTQLLNPIEAGLYDDNWRIRQSSVTLLGDLMQKIIKGDDTEHSETDTAVASERLLSALGRETRDRIQAMLYLLRADVSSTVRTISLNVWKSVVSNTPRALREILPILMRIVIESLGNESLDKRQVAGRTLSDLVSKLGESLLPEIIPILEVGLESEDGTIRQGVCLGLCEVMKATSKTLLTQYTHVLTPTVQKALCDPLESVREAAGEAFEKLIKIAGQGAVEEVVPKLLKNLQSEDEEEVSSALEGLRQILSHKPASVLPIILPRLLAPPLTASNVKALAAVGEVAGDALEDQIPTLVPSLIKAIANAPADQSDELRKAAQTIVLSIEGDGVRVLISELTSQLENGATSSIRVESAGLISTFCADPDIELAPDTTSQLLQSLLKQFNDSEVQIQTACLAALTSLTSSIKKETVANYLMVIGDVLRELQEQASTKGGLVPGFCLPKGVAPLLPIFTQALLTGSPQAREEAAQGLLILIKLTSDAALKPHLIQLVGPLVRITSDKFPWEVKAAILHILHLSIVKGGIVLKIIIGPLQTTFVKALQDPQATQVRTRAALALGAVVALNPKVDPVVTELLTLAAAPNASEITESILFGLKEVLLQAGKNVTPDIFAKVKNQLSNQLETEDENIRTQVARAIGGYAKFAPASQLEDLVRSKLLVQDESWAVRHGSLLALANILQCAPENLMKFRGDIFNFLKPNLKDEKAAVRQASAECLGQIILLPEVAGDPAVLNDMLTPIVELLSDNSTDVKIVSINAIKEFSKVHPEVTQSVLTTIIPPLLTRVKDRSNVAAKAATERALMHALQIHGNPEILNTYSQTLPGENGKAFVDYAKRILAKLEATSDSEDEDAL
eukprot:TRINITY_DN7050_c0_g1_i1.p1 TRINITY_DN7050_c0_g1~~TRINITY_DN7050_c0_g1_i1.p1  ORF type:complete len:2656 (+),score=946.17 TRINITY_DN7050_c0_g1_i1:489-7970(+)